jgi:urea transport system substrate-binding protein
MPSRLLGNGRPTLLARFAVEGQNMFVVVPFIAASDEPSVRAFVAKARREAGAEAVVSSYVMTHYNALIALKFALVKSGKVDKEAFVDALETLVIPSPTGRVTIGKNHHVTMNMFMARTQGASLVQIQALGEIAPDPECK